MRIFLCPNSAWDSRPCRICQANYMLAPVVFLNVSFYRLCKRVRMGSNQEGSPERRVVLVSALMLGYYF